MKLNKKGFTLIELLAVIIILGIILTIAIPNTVSMIDRNKKKTFTEDAKNMITLAEYTVRKNAKIDLPTSGNIVILTLEYLNTNDIVNSPYGLAYSKSRSFVAIYNKTTGSNTEYIYYVHLVACSYSECYNPTGTFDGEIAKNRGFSKLQNLTELNASDRTTLVKRSSQVNPDLIDNYARIRQDVGATSTANIKVYSSLEP